MTADIRTAGAASHAAEGWHTINWKSAYRIVCRLQARIVKAIQEGRWGKVKALQYLLTHSFSGKALAIRRVTENQGKGTPGVDREIWDTPEKKATALQALRQRGYNPQPLRRVYIPKKNGKMRPLGIPTMGDRAMQALYLQALDPIAETMADPNSYGFRKERATADAIDQCHIVLSNRGGARWIFEGDIKSCFDRISHEWLMAQIPMCKTILQKWLKAGFMEKHVFYATEEGTPQGGICTPPTMLRRTLLGASLKRGWTDPIHDADLLLVDLDFLHQGPNNVPSRVPVGLLQLLGNAFRELLQLADHQPQFHFLVGLVNPLPTLILQLGQALARRQDPRLEFRLVEQPVAVGIDQS
jgi:RNA-directed DNA polymerase